MMKRLLGLVACTLTVAAVVAAEMPYDEKANAKADVQQAIATAKGNHKDVLLIFGANWCTDCRELDKALHGSSQALVSGRFEVVKIDVGNFNKNLDIASQYGNPIKSGIPAVVVLTSDNTVVYSTKGGELANARKMGETGIYDFLAQHVAGGTH
jgi:protein disulfide-isomerase